MRPKSSYLIANRTYAQALTELAQANRQDAAHPQASQDYKARSLSIARACEAELTRLKQIELPINDNQGVTTHDAR